jgi:outer membrane protein TolC
MIPILALTLSTFAAAQPSIPLRLSLQEAVELAYARNVQMGLAVERVSRAEARKSEAVSEYLPSLNLTISQDSRNINLAALGFTPGTFPGIPTVLGPFGVFDARIKMTQRLIDVGSVFHRKSAQAALEAAKLDLELTKEQTAATAALAYIEAVRADRALEAAKADLDLATSLRDLARDRLKAGVATGIDVAREETRLAEATLEETRAENASAQARLRLQRIVGLAQGEPLILTDDLKSETSVPPSVSDAVSQGLGGRREVGLAEKNLASAQADLKAARAVYAPVLSVYGDVGISATTPIENQAQTHTIGARIDMPVFEGKNSAQTHRYSSFKSQAELLLADEREQVEEDVRLALDDLSTGRQQVAASQTALSLAQRELTLARDRFSSGVGNTIEVLSAEDALARARREKVEALAVLHRARLSLAAAVGAASAFRL